MAKKRVMVAAENMDLSAVKYEKEQIKAPHLTGFFLKLFVWIVEAPVIGSFIISLLKKQNQMTQLLRNTWIPEAPMFKPEFPPQEPETGVVVFDEDGKPEDRVEAALKCLPNYDPAASCLNKYSTVSFQFWKIRDYAYAYCSKIATPSMVAEQIISALEEFSKMQPPQPMLLSFDARCYRIEESSCSLNKAV